MECSRTPAKELESWSENLGGALPQRGRERDKRRGSEALAEEAEREGQCSQAITTRAQEDARMYFLSYQDVMFGGWAREALGTRQLQLRHSSSETL